MQETNKNEKDLLSIGKSYFENKDYQNAIKTFSKATKLKPDNIDNWFWLGQSHLRIMQYKQAIKSFKKAFELNPNNKSILNLLESHI